MFKNLTLIILTMFFIGSIQAAPIVIDSFDDQFLIEDTTIDGSAVTTDIFNGSMIGSHVRASVELLSSNQGVGSANLQVTPAGTAVFSTDSGTTGEASLFYGGSTFSTDGLGSIDFTEGGSNAFTLGLSESDQGFPFSATVWWNGGVNSVTTDFTSLGFDFPGGERVIGFDEFVGVDFTDVSAFQLNINVDNSLADSQVAVDLALLQIETNEVPAPGSNYLFGLGLLCLAGATANKKLNKKRTF